MSEVISTPNFDRAFAHVYSHRKTANFNSDIFSLSLDWLNIRQLLQVELLSGRYQLSPVKDGKHYLVTRGIAKGCPLSPKMGALMLKSLDLRITKDVYYVRYMDDWVILVKSRTLLRRLIKKMHRVMQELKFELALDKTYIGKISNGFDFLGYRFNHQGIIGLAKKTIDNFIEHIAAQYVQDVTLTRIGQYVRRWISWCMAGGIVFTSAEQH